MRGLALSFFLFFPPFGAYTKDRTYPDANFVPLENAGIRPKLDAQRFVLAVGHIQRICGLWIERMIQLFDISKPTISTNT